MTMDIDAPFGEGKAEEASEPSVFVHPLALVHMSDQYTRIRWGGSPLDSKAPVTGLLFGKRVDSLSMFVEDADDIPLEDAQKQIELYQAVFPKRQVMGWYRVVGPNDSNEPTPEDLRQTQKVLALCHQNKEEPPPSSTFFGLLQVPKPVVKKKPEDESAMKTEKAQEQTKDEDEEEELPLTLFRLDSGSGVLVAVSTWSLQTAEPERIAVQRVIREKGGNESQKDNKEHAIIEQKVVIPYTDEVQESCLAISTRLMIVLEYVESLQKEEPPLPSEHLPLLRQVQGLLLQLGPIAATVPTSVEMGKSQLQQLATLAKAVDAVTLFSEKFRFLHEHSGSGRGGGPSAREVRRY